MKPKISNSFPINETLSKRWSPRAFRNAKVSDEDLRSLFEAARWAPSCFNEQPWRFIVTVNGTPAFDKLLSTLADANKEWVRSTPVLVATFVKENFSRNDKPNKHASHDLGLAMGNLLSEATSRGLYVHQMAGFSPEDVKEEFDIPDGFEPWTTFVVGHLGDPESLDDKAQEAEEAPQKRKEQSEIVFIGEWGNPE